MPEVPYKEPEWVERMRQAGYNVRVGRGEPLPEVPETFFYPPPTRSTRIRGSLVRGYKKLVRALTSARRTTHAPFP